MLKIKDDILLYKLEEFGFKRVDSTYEYYEYCGTWGVGLNRIITPLKVISEQDLDVLFSLIHANLVKKVEADGTEYTDDKIVLHGYDFEKINVREFKHWYETIYSKKGYVEMSLFDCIEEFLYWHENASILYCGG